VKTPLTTAAYDGQLERVKELLDRGANANGDDEPKYTDEAEGCLTNEPYYTPLGEAARAGHASLVRLLLDAGAKTSIGETTGTRPRSSSPRSAVTST